MQQCHKTMFPTLTLTVTLTLASVCFDIFWCGPMNIAGELLRETQDVRNPHVEHLPWTHQQPPNQACR